MRRDRYAGPDAPVFATAAGTPLNPSAVAGRIVKPAARAIGLPWVHCHTLRRTAGSWLLQDGRTPVQVCRFLGHSDPGFTLRSTYVGLVDEGVGDVAIFDAALDAPRGVAAGTQKATRHPQDRRKHGRPISARRGATEGAALHGDYESPDAAGTRTGIVRITSSVLDRLS